MTASSCTSSRTSGTATASRSTAGSDIWLNEGFATYAEWLWSEHEGLGTPQEIFDDITRRHPRRRSVLETHDRRPRARRDVRRAGLHPWRDDAAGAARDRSATTRSSASCKRWASDNRNGNGTTPQFIKLAERISGQELDAFFQTWLFTPSKPDVPAAAALASPSLLRARSRRSRVGVRSAHARHGCATQARSTPSRRAGASAASHSEAARPSATASPLPRLCVTPTEPWPVASTRPPTPG